MEDIDTPNRAIRLKGILEICIQSLVSIGSSATSGHILLSRYVIETLHLNAQEWEEVSSSAIRQQIYLTHIQALYLLLE